MFDQSPARLECEVLPPLTVIESDASPYGDVILTSEQLALWLETSSDELRRMRKDGGGPSFICIRQQTYRYRLSDVRNWLDRQTLTRLPDRPARGDRKAA